jgi:hypothetical protein
VFWISLHREHRRWLKQIEQAQQWLDTGAPWLFETAPHVSSWSPTQHMHHVADINQRIIDQLMSDEDGAANTDGAGRPNIAGYVVLTLGRLPRGRGRSPEAFYPPDMVDREELARRVDANRKRLDTLADHLDTLRQSDRRFPHPVLGHLDASEWLRFARVHTGHHHRIIRDIAGAVGEE